jgi:outer membrane biosynthesis protein TonB
MNVTAANQLAAKEKTSMSNSTVDAEKTPAAAAQPSQPEAKRKKATKVAKPAKKAKATKKAKPVKKATGKPKPEGTNKKAEVIAMMKRAKGATLAEIVEATGWQKHTVRGFVSILGNKGGEKIESSKNAAGERTYKIAK